MMDDNALLHFTGHLMYRQGRALGLDTIRIPNEAKRFEVADFHDIVALAYYGETEESIRHFIWLRTGGVT